jgi:hypothetical protein
MGASSGVATPLLALRPPMLRAAALALLLHALPAGRAGVAAPRFQTVPNGFHVARAGADAPALVALTAEEYKPEPATALPLAPGFGAATTNYTVRPARPPRRALHTRCDVLRRVATCCHIDVDTRCL